jgi:hypothetical protein
MQRRPGCIVTALIKIDASALLSTAVGAPQRVTLHVVISAKAASMAVRYVTWSVAWAQQVDELMA